MRKDKIKVIGEQISDEKIKYYLTLEPLDDTPADLYKLIKAYRGLRNEDFARFIKFFIASGFSFTKQNKQGLNFAQIISKHKNADLYLKAINAN